MSVRAMAWVLEAPRETLRAPPAELGRVQALLVASSAIASAALGEALASRSGGLLAVWNIFWYFAGAAVHLYLLWRFSGVLDAPARSLSDWLRVSAIAWMPLHLLLPAGWVARSLGTAGFLMFAVFKLVIYLALLRRWVWAAEALTGWPSWGATLLVLSPLWVALVGVLFAAAFLFLVLGAVLLGIWHA